MFFDKIKKEKKNLWLITGLGNPGIKYEHTRHNAGFDVIDILSEKYDIKLNTQRFKGIFGKGKIEGMEVYLAKPLTFMNESGSFIRDFAGYYKIDVGDRFLVIYDDISLAPGNIRIRKKGSAGGHNGIKDIIEKTGTEEFKRIKVGVGEKAQNEDLVRHVLGKMKGDDLIRARAAMENAVSAAELIIKGETDNAMNVYNAKVR